MILAGENRSARIKTCPLPLCPLQAPHGRACNRIRAFAVRSRWLQLISNFYCELNSACPKSSKKKSVRYLWCWRQWQSSYRFAGKETSV